MIKFKREDGTYSRTQRFNTIAAVLPVILATLPGVREQISSDLYGWLIMGLSVVVPAVNVYLRQTTTQGVK